MKVYLIRHAMSEDAEKGISQKDDSPLALDAIKDKSISYYQELEFDKIFCSPLLRATQTAERLFGDYEIVDYIYEYKRPKKLDGVPRKEARKFWSEHWKEATVDPNWSHDGSESFNAIIERVDKFYKFLKGIKSNRVAVVGHSIFFRHLLSVHALGKKNYTIDKYYKLSAHIKPYPLHYLKMEL